MKHLTIISGGSRGIGAAIGENLCLLDESYTVRLCSSMVDLCDFDKTYAYISSGFRHAITAYDQINLILCAAQIGEKTDNIHECDIEQFSDLYRINVLGNFAIIKAIAEMTCKKKLRIVWFAGGGAAFPFSEYFGYSLTKVAVARAVENLSIMLKKDIEDVSIIALAPGAIDTDMLREQERQGIKPRTRTDISEPVNFVRNFITDQFDSQFLNGKFLHVRDDLKKVYTDVNMFKLRRKE